MPRKSKNQELQWKVHTANLLQEILSNAGTSILAQPLKILGRLLAEVGERASQLNDPELNHLMCRLTIYSVADPKSPDYDPLRLKEIEQLAKKSHPTKLGTE